MSKISNAPGRSTGESYATWSDQDSFSKASKSYAKALDISQPIIRSSAAIANRFQNIDLNTSVRDTFGDVDYAFFRPNEMVPRHFRDIIAACMAAYQKVPVIKEVIDLMGDFTAQGIKLVHKNESVERFYNEWFRRVGGPERSERIANVLYRAGNVIVKRADARLNAQITSDWKKVVADTDLNHEDEAKPGRYEVPFRYTIINPLIVEVLGEHVAAFTGKVHYVLKLPSTFYNTLSLPLTSFDPSLLTEGMPRDLQQAMDRNERYLLLDSDKLILLFYKKDDWDVWAYPILYSLLDEILLLQKLKKADMTALDGVISHIRVWKLGSLEHKLFPTDAAVSKLSNILLNHLGGGSMDLIWGPDLELDQTGTDIANFLGSEKYEFCMSQIHGGLGIPAAISGKKGSKGGGMSQDFMSVRILLERLNYGRQVLNRFWEGEIKRVQEAMGFRYPARIQYDNIIMNDETSEKALWLQLVDRDLCPVEAVQERFGRIPEIDNIIMMREERQRRSGKMPTKVSPYVDAQPKLSLTKVGMQTGIITPSELPPELDLNLKEPSPEHEELKENQFPPPAPAAKPISSKKKPTGVAGQGRPGGSKDKKKRKQRIPKASQANEFIKNVAKGNLWQQLIAEVVDPYFLHKNECRSVSELTKEQGMELTQFKFNILLNCKSEYPISKETIVKDILDQPIEVYNLQEDYTKLCKSFQEKLNRPLVDSDLITIKSYIYALTR